ncbi:hypothetical protein, partial [Klebsiella pneumoniae]|uniref:hypothetical protein n=1 Tax=Klebsiella pneumoniae TaxID=573 RepID=UPI0027303E2D
INKTVLAVPKKSLHNFYARIAFNRSAISPHCVMFLVSHQLGFVVKGRDNCLATWVAYFILINRLFPEIF